MPLKQMKKTVKQVKNPNWQEADQLAIYQGWLEIWTQDYRETNPASDS